eukprot:g19442.t1
MSARASPVRPVVSRVKLPQPGRGQVRVADITAGSGCAEPGSRSGSARSLAARSVPTPVLDSSPGAAVTRHVRTPELRHGSTLESIRTSTGKGFEASLPAASVWNPVPLPDPPVTPRPDVAPDHVAPNAATATPPVSQLHSKEPRVLRANSDAKPSVRAAPGRPKSRPRRQGSSGPRPQSEPPQTGQTGVTGVLPGVLPKLLDEIEDHLLRQTARPPVDASSWLQETAQLEIYAEERGGSSQAALFEAGELVTEAPSAPARARGRRAAAPKGSVPVRELSVLRGDKELRWARQQLKNCELEYLHLQQLLGSSEKQLSAQLRQARRVKQLERENHKRERSIARAAERAGGGELGLLAVDGNARALREVERLEAELEVFQMKNSNLRKQPRPAVRGRQDEETRLQQNVRSREAQAVKYETLMAKLESEETQRRLAEEQRQVDSEQLEEEQLRAEIRRLQEQRRSGARSTERTLKDRLRRLEELRSQQNSGPSALVDEDIMPLAPNDDLVEPCTAQVVEGADAGGLENPSEESPDPVGVAEDFREVEVEDASGAGEGEQGEAGDAKDGEVEPEEEQHAEKEEENEEMKEKEEHDAENQEREETDEKENEENEEKEKDEEIPEVERAHFEMAELHGVSDDEVPEEEVPPVAVEASLDEVEDPHEMDAEERSQSEIEAAGGVISAAEAPKDASDPPVAEVCEEAVRQEDAAVDPADGMDAVDVAHSLLPPSSEATAQVEATLPSPKLPAFPSRSARRPGAGADRAWPATRAMAVEAAPAAPHGEGREGALQIRLGACSTDMLPSGFHHLPGPCSQPKRLQLGAPACYCECCGWARDRALRPQVLMGCNSSAVAVPEAVAPSTEVVAVESLDDGLDRLPELSVSQPLHAPDDAAASTGQKSHFEERTRVLTVRRGVRARATPNRAVRAPILESAVESADGISGPLFPIGREDEPRVPMASPEREARDAKSEALRVTKPSPTVSVKSGGALSANASPFRLSESLYDSDDEHSGSHRRRGATAFGALGSDLPFLKWSEPHRFRERARDGRGENPARWAQPRASRRGAAGPERTPEPLEPRLTPEEQQRLGKLAARAREVRELIRPQLKSEMDLAEVIDQVHS